MDRRSKSRRPCEKTTAVHSPRQNFPVRFQIIEASPRRAVGCANRQRFATRLESHQSRVVWTCDQRSVKCALGRVYHGTRASVGSHKPFCAVHKPFAIHHHNAGLKGTLWTPLKHCSHGLPRRELNEHANAPATTGAQAYQDAHNSRYH